MSKLNVLDAWKDGVSKFFAPKSAQGFLQPAMAAAGVYASSCGAGDEKKDKEKPAACGASCGAADEGKKEEKPSSCGAGDEKPKPSACGAGDGK